MGTRHVHITGVGYDPNPIIKVMRSGLACDRLHLLWNDEDNDPIKGQSIRRTKDEIIETLRSSLSEEGALCEHKTDVSDYKAVLETVMRIADMEKRSAEEDGVKVEFHMNITHGTRFVSGAMCTASLILGAELYYFKERDESTKNAPLDDLITTIPTPNIPDVMEMTPKRREFLKRICEEPNGNGVMFSELATEFKSKQNANQFVRYFKENKMVVVVKEDGNKSVRVVPTEIGMMVSGWLI